LCKAFHFLHDTCHIIHTDLKPENVLVKHSSTPIPDISKAMKLPVQPPTPPPSTGAVKKAGESTPGAAVGSTQALNIEKVEAQLSQRDMSPTGRRTA
jgi:serine/threonine protein kinase